MQAFDRKIESLDQIRARETMQPSLPDEILAAPAIPRPEVGRSRNSSLDFSLQARHPGVDLGEWTLPFRAYHSLASAIDQRRQPRAFAGRREGTFAPWKQIDPLLQLDRRAPRIAEAR